MSKILIIGDSCRDIFVYGNCDRICPEAPVPIFNPTHQTENGGMAKNVATNLSEMNCKGTLLTNTTEIIKTRFVDNRTNQIVVRVDENDTTDRIKEEVLYSIKDNVHDNEIYDALIISDYCKGFLEEDDIEYLAENNKNVFLDTKKRLNGWCDNIDFIKINNFEYEKTKDSINMEKWSDKLIVTMGSDGCLYNGTMFPVPKVTDIKDLSGAGDTFLAGLVSKYVETSDIEKAIYYAQECATIVVQKHGVATI